MANNHVMIDLETVDVIPTATILSIGAVRFDPNGNELENPEMEMLYMQLDIDTQAALGFTVSDSTIEWWAKQSPEAIKAAFEDGERLTVIEAATQLHKFVWNADAIWAQGIAFDIPMCEHLFLKAGLSVPWNFYDVKDSRTLFKLGIDAERPPVLSHHAGEDAWGQAVGVQNVLRKLNKILNNNR
jgi:hypothetical protein